MKNRYSSPIWILCRLALAVLMLMLTLLLPSSVNADCAMDESTLPETFDRARFVVRLLYNCPRAVVNVTCNVEVYDGTEYVISDTGYQSYTVAEIFKQDWTGLIKNDDDDVNLLLQPGRHIAVLYDSDTGFWKDLPLNLIADARGTLAFLTPYRQCLEELNNDNSSSGPGGTYSLERGEGLLENPFLLNECSALNQQWSDLSEQDVAFLRSQEGYLNMTDNGISGPMIPDTILPPTEESTKSSSIDSSSSFSLSILRTAIIMFSMSIVMANTILVHY